MINLNVNIFITILNKNKILILKKTYYIKCFIIIKIIK